MIKLGRSGTQAKRRTHESRKASLVWEKSYNWVFLLLPLAALTGFIARADSFMPVRTIDLSGSFEYIDQDRIENSLRVYLGENFLSLSIPDLQRSLQAHPWASTVSVRRIWPDRVDVVVGEKIAVARWDDNHLLSNRGEVYVADSDAFLHLPLVNGINHPPADVLRQFYRLEARFRQFDEQLSAFRIDGRGAIEIKMIDDLTVKFGRENVAHKIDRLFQIYSAQIIPRRESIKRLDLRYSNGFAVTWKEEKMRTRNNASIWSNGNV